MVKRATLVIIAMISTLGLSSFKSDANENDEVKTSYVSYYHEKFDGRRTASGAVFSNRKLTAAHRTLPFGTKVKLTNPKTGESVVVTINDRGPFHPGRAMDISKAAFDSIGNPDSGILAIEYQVVGE